MANTFAPGGKRKNGGDELPHAQWIIRNSKNKTIAHHIINNIQESHIEIHTRVHSI